MSSRLILGRRRLIVDGQSAVYHVVSRTACRQYLFKDREKEMFVRMMRKQASFSGVEVLAYCVMSNHFHILLRVPEECEITDAELLRRYQKLYGGKHCPASVPRPDVLAEMLRKNTEEGQYWRKKLLARMHDLRSFMRELKQRFGIWYNHTHRNQGTIWAERYRSVLIEDKGEALSTVAAYIDLNPVRAEIVDDPAKYRHSSYAAALGGNANARRAYQSFYRNATPSNRPTKFEQAIAAYHFVLYGKGEKSKGTLGKDQGTIDKVKVRKKLANGGKISLQEALHLRIRYMSDGAILGSREYVQQLTRQLSDSMRRTVQSQRSLQEESSTKQSKRQPHRLQGIQTDSLYSYRKLIHQPVG